MGTETRLGLDYTVSPGCGWGQGLGLGLGGDTLQRAFHLGRQAGGTPQGTEQRSTVITVVCKRRYFFGYQVGRARRGSEHEPQPWGQLQVLGQYIWFANPSHYSASQPSPASPSLQESCPLQAGSLETGDGNDLGHGRQNSVCVSEMLLLLATGRLYRAFTVGGPGLHLGCHFGPSPPARGIHIIQKK